MGEVVLATRNRGKLSEFDALLSPLGWLVRSVMHYSDHEPKESGSTFVENALIKARHACEASGHPSIADDSGLVVPALGGAPGVISARYGGLPSNDLRNNEKLLAEMASLERVQRGALFVCVLVYLRHAGDPLPLISTGLWRGEILRAPRGSAGFGYDPLFFDPTLQRSAAELAADDKARVSHRGQATRRLLELLRADDE